MSDLIFKGLVIHNFKSFIGTHELSFDREPGLIYVAGKNLLNPELGANGCGKTTLWDALTWCCWGKTGRDSRPANAVIPWGQESGKTYVEFKFRRLNQTQIIKRGRRPNLLELTFPKTGEARTITQDDIPGLLGMSEDMFRRTVVLGQFGSLFLDIGPEKQSQMFNEALNLDIWLRASRIAQDNGVIVERSLTLLVQELSTLQGRQAELTQFLERETAAAASYNADRKAKLDQLNKASMAKSRELDELLAKASPQDRPGRAKSTPKGSKDLETAITEKRRAWAELGRKHADVEAQNRALRRQKGETKEKVASYQASIDGARTCPECGQKASLTHLQTKLDTERKTLKGIESQQALFTDDLDTLPGQIDAIGKELQTLEQSQRQVSRLEGEINALVGERDILEEAQNPHNTSVSETKGRLAKVDSSIKKAETGITEAETFRATCDFWDDAFKEIRLSLIDQVLSELEMSVSRHAENLGLVDWGIKFKTERTTSAGTVSTVFTILLYPPDTQEPVRLESYSGGENQRWQLAMAFGLSEVILTRSGVTPTIEVLDEPTRGLSSEGVEDLLEHLRERALELGRTIFVTEHHSLERGLFDGTITIKKDAQGSTIVE